MKSKGEHDENQNLPQLNDDESRGGIVVEDTLFSLFHALH